MKKKVKNKNGRSCLVGQHDYHIENVWVYGGVYVICRKCGDTMFKVIETPDDQKLTWKGEMTLGGDPNNPFPIKDSLA